MLPPPMHKGKSGGGRRHEPALGPPSIGHAVPMNAPATSSGQSNPDQLFPEPPEPERPDPDSASRHRSEGDGPGPGPPTVVYTDGACRGNPGPGGWAWAVDGGPSDSGGEPHTTNQRMEVMAVIRALQSLPGPLHVISDSTYVVNCFRQKWWVGWKRRGWRTTQGKAVANLDLWQQLLDLALDPSRSVTFAWVKGHSGDRMNDVVDLLATQAADLQ
jgi:ribonuclease HI